MTEAQLQETAQAAGPRALLEVEQLSKSYGPIRALRQVSLAIRAGEIHGICGHNGAGKSTFVKTLVGLTRPDEGVLRMDGGELHLRDPRDAQAHGIAIVDQELSLVPALSVEDNIFLGSIDTPLFHRRKELHRRARALLDRLGLRELSLGTRVERLAMGERQLVEIARLLARDARLLILDEPTATLSKPEIARVFSAVREVVADGRSVVFVSHRLDEVFELCDRVTVFRDGQCVATHSIGELDRQTLINLILGEMEGEHAAEAAVADAAGAGGVSVEIRNLGVAGRVAGFTLDAREGQVVGLAGQVGSGTSEVLRALGGLIPDASGEVRVRGRRIRLNTPRSARDGGILYLSNDRKAEGLFVEHSVRDNLTVSRLEAISRLGFIVRRRAHRTARHLAELVAVDRSRVADPASSLSGGNQQKVLLGRGLNRKGTVLLALDEPTRGVDVGARAAIHRLIRNAAAEGLTIFFSSTELDEILELSDVIVTMFGGRIVSVVPSAAATASGVLADMTVSRAPAAPVGG